MSNLRVLIVDDDDILREGLAVLLRDQPEIDVIATAANGAEALDVLTTHTVDVALIDVEMPVMDGIQTAKLFTQRYPDVTVVMLTAFEHQESLAESLKANVHGFLTKDIPPDQLAQLIKQAFSGMHVMAPIPGQLLADAYLQNHEPSAQSAAFKATVEMFPTYLKKVFDLLIQAKPNKTIAKELGLSSSTVRGYVSEIFSATGFTNRGELTIAAIKAGY